MTSSYGEIVERLADAGKDLVDAISFDVNGIALPVGYQGGNGGLVSRDTIQKADALRRAIEAARRALTVNENG